FSVWNRVSEPKQQMTFRSRSHAFQVETLGLLGSSLGRFGQTELCVARVSQQVRQQTFTRFAKRVQDRLTIGDDQVCRKESVAIRTRLAVLISAMRTKPINPLTNPRAGFEVRFKILSFDFQKRITVEFADRRSSLVTAVNP